MKTDFTQIIFDFRRRMQHGDDVHTWIAHTSPAAGEG